MCAVVHTFFAKEHGWPWTLLLHTKERLASAECTSEEKHRGSMGMYASKTSPKCFLNGCRTSKGNIKLNERAHECLVFARVASQRGTRMTRERRRRERRKIWAFEVIEGHKNTQKCARNTHAHIFEKCCPPQFSQKWRGRPPIFENVGGDRPRNPPGPPPPINGCGRGNTGLCYLQHY